MARAPKIEYLSAFGERAELRDYRLLREEELCPPALFTFPLRPNFAPA